PDAPKKIYAGDEETKSKCAAYIEYGLGGQAAKILKHLGLWVVKVRSPPRETTLTKQEPSLAYSLRGLGPYGPETSTG
ncbi:MAG: hypothetical protein R6T98_09915, partial [Desulfatiglandales bacterium]